mmetsp:Transcript_87829/g.268762  ORF Transcript_87829/g.268762 Transcript_87829/m.268762 type:complete len:228 (+) Transcript_87829:390-1073(+)
MVQTRTVSFGAEGRAVVRQGPLERPGPARGLRGAPIGPGQAGRWTGPGRRRSHLSAPRGDGVGDRGLACARRRVVPGPRIGERGGEGARGPAPGLGRGAGARGGVPGGGAAGANLPPPEATGRLCASAAGEPAGGVRQLERRHRRRRERHRPVVRAAQGRHRRAARGPGGDVDRGESWHQVAAHARPNGFFSIRRADSDFLAQDQCAGESRGCWRRLGPSHTFRRSA